MQWKGNVMQCKLGRSVQYTIFAIFKSFVWKRQRFVYNMVTRNQQEHLHLTFHPSTDLNVQEHNLLS